VAAVLGLLRNRTSEARIRSRAASQLGMMWQRDRGIGKVIVPELVRALDDPHRDVRISAVFALRDMGSQARPAVAVFLRKLAEADYLPGVLLERNDERAEKWSECAQYVTALAQIGRPAVPELVRALRSGQQTLRITAAEILGKIGPEARDAAPALLEALKDPDYYLRSPAARALGRVHPPADQAIPALRDVLVRDPVSFVAHSAAEGLACFGADAVPVLVEVLKSDRRAHRRHYAAAALGRIGPQARDAIGPLQQALRDPDHEVRRLAAYALRRIAGQEPRHRLR
jgi:HEAT repeat protein